MSTPILSKSKYLAGLQCPRLLWTHFNEPDAVPKPDAATEAIFTAGHQVGDLAKRLFPTGAEVPRSRDLQANRAATRELLERRVPIFEAAFLEDDCYCAVDVLVPVGDDAWDLYEVKSSTTVKPVNVHDVAFQARLIEQAGLKLRRLFLMHVDRTYVRDGEVDPAAMLHAEDVTAEARARQTGVARRVASMRAVIAGPRPDTPLGSHCTSPYRCDLWKHCAADLPEQPVTQLYRGKRTAFDLLARGVAALADAPPGELNEKQRIQRQAVIDGAAHVDPDPIRAWLAALTYPLYAFDFETMMAAVPLLDGTRPYQQIPFQFSLHVVDAPGAEPRHVEFLADTADDPRPALIEALRAVGDEGDVLAFNMTFERMILAQLADAFPARRAFLERLSARLLDLIVPFREFWYHSPAQKGRCSLKNVLPALTGTSYEGMAIADGGAAMREFVRVTFGEADVGDKARVLGDLRAYCAQDTRALLDILESLRGLVAREAVD